MYIKKRSVCKPVLFQRTLNLMMVILVALVNKYKKLLIDFLSSSKTMKHNEKWSVIRGGSGVDLIQYHFT